MVLCRYAMQRMIDLHTGVQTALKVHNTGKALQLVHNCVANDLSALYFDSIKDTMCVLHVFPLLPLTHPRSRYCDSRMSPHRLAAQTMLWRVLRTLVQSFAPILPHLAEDVFQEAPVLFTHGSTFTHSEQSAKEYGSSVFHYGLQQPALYGENAGRTYSAELASDISESYNMVAGDARNSLPHFLLFYSPMLPPSQPCFLFALVRMLPSNALAALVSWGRLQMLC